MQQGQPIVGDAENDELGWSVAMSADAKTLVVGADGFNDDTGYVKVYRANDDGWNSMQLIGQGLAAFGSVIETTCEADLLCQNLSASACPTGVDGTIREEITVWLHFFTGACHLRLHSGPDAFHYTLTVTSRKRCP